VRLLIIRHGPAGDREKWAAEGRDDRLRPLTREGKLEMQEVAAGLARLVPTIDVFVTSPLVRAAESAAIVSSSHKSKIVTLDLLAPGHEPDGVLRWLADQRPAQTVALVGHEPDLGQLAGYLLTKQPTSFIDLKKGGACLLDLNDPPKPGRGTLKWLLTPRTLRMLGEAG
jgi:phosphohistidine phosphatase